jgi:hypothetical protein
MKPPGQSGRYSSSRDVADAGAAEAAGAVDVVVAADSGVAAASGDAVDSGGVVDAADAGAHGADGVDTVGEAAAPRGVDGAAEAAVRRGVVAGPGIRLEPSLLPRPGTASGTRTIACRWCCSRRLRSLADWR